MMLAILVAGVPVAAANDRNAQASGLAAGTGTSKLKGLRGIGTRGIGCSHAGQAFFYSQVPKTCGLQHAWSLDKCPLVGNGVHQECVKLLSGRGSPLAATRVFAFTKHLCSHSPRRVPRAGIPIASYSHWSCTLFYQSKFTSTQVIITACRVAGL